jgi:hypothetical protein
MDRIQVAYSRKVSQQVADGKFETISLGGSVEFDVPENEQWQESYEGAYITYKLIVDQLLDEAVPKAQVVASTPAQLPGERIAPKQQPLPSANTGGIVAHEQVSFTNCRVINKEVKMTRTNKEFCSVFIRNADQIPGQSTNAKSFEPQIVARLKALNEGDMIDVAGYFEPWKVNPNKFDLVVQSVDRSA